MYFNLYNAQKSYIFQLYFKTHNTSIFYLIASSKIILEIHSIEKKYLLLHIVLEI